MSFVYDANTGKIDSDNTGRLRRELSSLKRNWESLKNIVESHLKIAEDRITLGINNKSEAEKMYQPIKVIAEWIGSFSSKIFKSSQNILRNVMDLKAKFD